LPRFPAFVDGDAAVFSERMTIGAVRFISNVGALTEACGSCVGLDQRPSVTGVFRVSCEIRVDPRVLAAGKPRISPLVQLFQIGQTVHR
jgi:hypothetical protein